MPLRPCFPVDRATVCPGLPALLLALLALLVLLCGSAVRAQPAAAAATADAPRQRLALVVATGLDSASRDGDAVTQALRQGGFEVLRSDAPTAGALQAALKTLREQLRPDGTALIYYTGPAAQLDGRNLLLPADALPGDALAAPAVAMVLRAAGVPLQDLLDVLAPDVPATRLLIVDAAYRHPVLARLSPPGLARQRVPAGSMLLLGHAPAALQDLPSLELQPMQPSAAPRAATRFAATLAEALATPRLSGPEALRAVRLAVIDATGGLTQPWLAGDTDARQPLADAARLEVLAAASAVGAAASPSGVADARVTLATLAAVPALPALSVAEAERRRTDGRTVQAPGRGERPLFQPRANSEGHAEGDVYSYELSDTVKDELLRSWTLAIEQVEPDGQLRANGGRHLRDAQGRTVLDTVDDSSGRDAGQQTRYEPAQLLWWPGAQAGEGRSIDHVERYRRADGRSGRIVWRGQAQVGTLRVLETPAGEFEVLPIRSRGEGIDTPDSGTPERRELQRTVWYAPRLRMPVAIEIEDNHADGKPQRRERIQLTHVQQGRTATP